MDGLDRLPKPHCLTQSQRHVAMLVREGLHRREIADLLGTTPRVLREEIGAIYEILGITDLLTLAFYVEHHRNQFHQSALKSSSVRAAIA